MKKVTYSEGFKEQARVKVFGRGNRTVQAVADELGVSDFLCKRGLRVMPHRDGFDLRTGW